jgi:NADH-quinone oxidoreductase subunit J
MSFGSGTEAALVTEIAFWLIAISAVIGAMGVVQFRDLFRAAMSLVVCLIAVAGLFVLLRAEFLAAVQIIVYVGAISVLLVFAIMITRDVAQGSPSNKLRLPAALIAALFLAATAFVVLNTDWNNLDEAIAADAEIGGSETLAAETVDQIKDIYSNTVPWVAGLLLRDFVLAFEAASVLLLAAIVGALALVRER